MKVLVVNTNRCRQPVATMPLGACLVAQAARDAGHEVRFLDLMFARRPEQALAAALERHQPQAVGLSLRNIDNNDSQTALPLAKEAAAWARVVRRHSRATLILGGSAVGVMPGTLLRHTGADLAAAGDGEVLLPAILSALERGDDPAVLPGVLSARGAEGTACPLAPAATAPLDECGVRDWREWVDVRAYLSRMAAVPLQAKRGCPFDCVYCTYHLAEGRTYRLHPPGRVAEAVARLASQGLRDIEFVDNVFNSPHEHAMEICRAVAGARPRARLQSMELNPRFVDDELLEAMESAGFVGIGLTVEGAADAPLRGLGKDYTAADVHRTADVVRRHRLPCFWLFMLGGPGETKETVRQTLRFAEAKVRPGDAAYFTLGVRVYPGTGLDRLARDEGLLTARPDEMLAPVFYFSPHTPADWLRREVLESASRRLNFVTGEALAHRLLYSLLPLARRLGVRTPLWRYAPAARRVLKLLGTYP